MNKKLYIYLVVILLIIIVIISFIHFWKKNHFKKTCFAETFINIQYRQPELHYGTANASEIPNKIWSYWNDKTYIKTHTKLA